MFTLTEARQPAVALTVNLTIGARQTRADTRRLALATIPAPSSATLPIRSADNLVEGTER